jgi:hypothetical protein
MYLSAEIESAEILFFLRVEPHFLLNSVFEGLRISTYRLLAIPHQKSRSRWEESRRLRRYFHNPEQAEFSIAVCHPPTFPLRLHPSP